MLNLVQIQDKLKDMPTQAIMAYANGQNPMVPPYLALGELNRRKGMEQAVMAEQAKEEPPTIKESTEQQLGLMNLQKQKAMQGQQQMTGIMANRPAPVPAGVGEEPVQMARGGIARLPMRPNMFRKDAYAGGGIVAFQDGGVTSGEDLMKKLLERAAKEQTMEEMIAQQKEARKLSGVSEDPYAESRQMREGIQAARAGRAEGQPMRELISYLTGISKAKPGQGLGVALGGGAEEQQKSAGEFASEQDKQKAQEMSWVRADEKEKDAIARGDAEAAIKYKRDKEKLSFDIAKLSVDKQRDSYNRFQTMLTQDPVIKSLEKQRQDTVGIKPGDEKWKWFDNAINARTKQLADQAGYDYKVVPYESPAPLPKKEKEKKSWFGGSDEKKEEPAKKASYDTGIPPGLPSGTTVAGRTPDGKVVYLTPDGKKVTEK